MVCSICKEAGHNATHCNGQFITEWTENIKRFWIYGHNNSVENDEAVKEWARNFRLTIPIINRLWEHIRGVNHEKRWWYLSQVDRERFVQTKFSLNKPSSVTSFRERIATYVRPAEQEPIAEALEARDRQVEERRQQQRQEREQRVRQQERQAQEQRDRVLAERIAQRQREAAEDPNAPVRRNLQRDFDRVNQMFRNAQQEAMRALRPKPQSSAIQSKMDAPETEYFENTDCPICLEALTPSNTVALDCRHTCCVACLKQTLKPGIKHCCPTCRADIKAIRFKSTISPENFNTISSHIHTLV
jgi:hypothetical protein